MKPDDQARMDGQPVESGSESEFDQQYALWRERQLELMDRQYREWRKNPLQTFPQDFEAWRKGQQEPDALITEEAVAHPHHGLAVDDLPITQTGASTSVGLATSNPDATSGNVSR